MLSDEEMKAIDNMKSLLLYSKEHEYFSPFQEQEIDDMNIVLNIIEKQSKEIEELKRKEQLIKTYKGNLSENVELICLSKSDFERNIGEDYISKDKIKAKIEEVKDGTFDAKIVLQSLLEKE